MATTSTSAPCSPGQDNDSQVKFLPTTLQEIDRGTIPSNSAIFFDNWSHKLALPTPAQILSKTHPDTPFRELQDKGGHFPQKIVHFPELRLIVKHGPRTFISEGHALWMFRLHCPEVKVPELYGWCREAGETFVYMSFIDGDTLESRLDSLSDLELRNIARQIAVMTNSMRRLRQPPHDIFLGDKIVRHWSFSRSLNRSLGSPDRGHVREQIWRSMGKEYLTVPFHSVKEFNEALFHWAEDLPMFPDHEFYKTFRSSFSDAAAIRLTHSDLAPCNIMISSTTTEVLAIVDWQECGWYPEFWEYIKMRYLAPDRWKACVDVALEEHYKTELEAFYSYQSTGIF